MDGSQRLHDVTVIMLGVTIENVRCNKFRQLRFNVAHIRRATQENIGCHPTGAPYIFMIPIKRVIGDQALKMEMGVFRHVLHNAIDAIIVITNGDDLVKGIGVIKILVCHGLGEHHRIGLFQDICSIPSYKGERKYLKTLVGRAPDRRLIEHAILILHTFDSQIRKAGGSLDLWENRLQGRCQGRLRIYVIRQGNPIYPVGILMKTVIT